MGEDWRTPRMERLNGRRENRAENKREQYASQGPGAAECQHREGLVNEREMLEIGD